MKECWLEGDLRAYVDRELPADDLERIAAHLECCATCRGTLERLSSRALLVSEGMGALDPTIPARPVRRPARWKWAAPAVGLAAALAIGIMAWPQRVEPPAPVAAVIPPAPLLVQEPARAGLEAYPTKRILPKRRPAETVERFVPLDGDPIENGVIMRVTYGPDNLQADIIFGPDGRARAYRLINAVQVTR
jgi:anti-sigma factor RsiW